MLIRQPSGGGEYFHLPPSVCLITPFCNTHSGSTTASVPMVGASIGQLDPHHEQRQSWPLCHPRPVQKCHPTDRFPSFSALSTIGGPSKGQGDCRHRPRPSEGLKYYLDNLKNN